MIVMGVASCGFPSTTAELASDGSGNQRSSAPTLQPELCRPEELEGFVVDFCELTDEDIVSGLWQTLDQAHPGLYTRRQLECIGANYLQLSAVDRASIASAVFNSASPAVAAADAAINRLFTVCGATVPVTH